MSVCEHDHTCPGYGPDHEAATTTAPRSMQIPPTVRRHSFFALRRQQPVQNATKDRSLPGKARRRARRAAR